MRSFLIALLVPGLLLAQSRAEYAGGTAPGIATGASGTLDVSDGHYLAFYTKKAQIRVPYDHINILEYGQKVDRRLLMALVISPVFLLAKKRKHFLTIDYTDDRGNHQALVFQVDKSGIRPALASLEARTGLEIKYQDEEARKAGRG